MQYIDIDSTYRNRNKYPLQADFDVLTNTLPANEPTDYVSNQTTIFPQPQTNPPMAYFEETLQQVLGAIVMKPNLPLMYMTPTDTIVQLDELVLTSVNPSTREYIQNASYQRGSIPLDLANEAYSGRILEDVNNREFRKIMFFSYDESLLFNNVFQTSTVLNTATFGNEFHVYTDTHTATSYPMSNIDRAYQGKYLLMITGLAVGSRRLISDYIPGINENDIQLVAPIAGIATGDQFQIVSDRRWFATIDQPFTNPLPLYPSYREPIPQVAIQFYQNIIYSGASSSISYIDMSDQVPVGTGIAMVIANGNTETATGYPLADIFYVASADNGGRAWREPIQVYTNVYLNRVSTVSIFGSSSNPQGYGSTPTITYAAPGSSFPDVSTQGAVFQQVSEDSNGQFGWQLNGGTYMRGLDTTLTYGSPPDRTSLVHAVGDDANVYANSAYVNYAANAPSLHFTYFDKFNLNIWITRTIDSDTVGRTIQVYSLINFYNSTSYGILYRKQWSMRYAYIVTNINTGEITYTRYDLGTTFQMSVSKFFMTNALNVNLGLIRYDNGATASIMTVLPVLSNTRLSAAIDAVTTTISVESTGTFMSGETIVIDTEYIIIGVVSIPSSEFQGCTRGALGSTAATHSIFAQVTGIDSDTFSRVYIAKSNSESGAVNDWASYALWDNQSLCSGFQGARLIQHTVGNVVTTYVFAWRQNTGLQVDFSTDVYTTSLLSQSTWNSPIILDASTIGSVDVRITDDNDLLVVYSRTTSSGVHELISLLLNTTSLGVARPYRIRSGVPLVTGSLGSLAGDGDTQVVLPLSARINSRTAYTNTYLYIYSGYTYNTFPTSNIYDDFRLIRAYDPDTNTITIASALSSDPNQYALSSIVDTAVWLSFLSEAQLLDDSSGNGYNFHVRFSTGNSSYVPEYTDTLGVTVENVLLLSDPTVLTFWGMERDVSADSAIQSIFSWNYAYEFTPFTISVWFLFEPSLFDQVIYACLHYGEYDPLSDPLTVTTAFIQNSDSHLIVSLPLNTTGTAITHDIGVVNTNTWYHLVLSCGSTANTCNIYLNRIPMIVNGQGSQYVGFINYISIGYIRVDSLSMSQNKPFVGYMKDFFVTAATYTQLQVDNAYYATLARGYYTLNWEILGDISNYFNALNYTAATIQTAQPICYEMELTHLTLPNVTLSSGFGNRIAFYPYVYVEFSSLNRNANNSIYSNNPAAEKVLFKIPIQSTASPLIANFVNNPSYMRQIVKFQPNDSFHFSVRLYNGEFFETALLDTTPPLPPNPLLQISATIGFKAVFK